MGMMEVWLVEPYEAIVLAEPCDTGSSSKAACLVRARQGRGRRGRLRGCDEARVSLATSSTLDAQHTQRRGSMAAGTRCACGAMGLGRAGIARVLLGRTHDGAGGARAMLVCSWASRKAGLGASLARFSN